MLYVVVGALVYCYTEDWSVVDAIYFCIVTMSTVGYGDYSPSTGATRGFTILMIFVGIGVVFPTTAAAVGSLTSPITAKGRALLEERFPQRLIDIDGDGVADFKIPRSAAHYYSKNMFPSVLLMVAIQVVMAAVMTSVEPNWTYDLALYHCFVTASTVGYGE